MVLQNSGFGRTGLGARSVCLQMNEGVELGLEAFDAPEMDVDNVSGRDLPGANAFGDFGDGGEGRKIGHKGSVRVFVHEMQVKRDAMCEGSCRR